MTGIGFSRDGSGLSTVCADDNLRTFSLASSLTDKRLASLHRHLREDPVDVAYGASDDSLVVLSSGTSTRLSVLRCSSAALESAAAGRSGGGAPLAALQDAGQRQEGAGGGLARGAPVSRRAWAGPQVCRCQIAACKSVQNASSNCMTLAAPVGGVVVAASAKQQLVVVSLEGKQLATLNTAGLVTHDVALSASGRFIATATFSSDVKVRRTTQQHCARCSLELS